MADDTLPLGEHKEASESLLSFLSPIMQKMQD